MRSDTEAKRRWLSDIRQNIKMAESFAAGISVEVFKDDNLPLYAVTRCLEIIAEASRRLPDELKSRYPSIEWQEMAAAGNIYQHEYEDVTARCVWRTLTVNLPLLDDVVTRELSAFE